MACSGCMSSSRSQAPFRPRARVDPSLPCVYTKEYLREISTNVAFTTIERAFILSQINVYEKNCNLFNVYIEDAIQRINQ